MTESSQRAPATIELAAVTVDCQDEAILAAFYQAAGGGEIISDGPARGGVTLGAMTLLPRRVEGYRAPTWPSPEVPVQIHFEFWIDDLPEAEARLQELGATTSEHQPHGDPGMLVMLDPAGHPFCIGTRV
jgi:hypothetical protein